MSAPAPETDTTIFTTTCTTAGAQRRAERVGAVSGRALPTERTQRRADQRPAAPACSTVSSPSAYCLRRTVLSNFRSSPCYVGPVQSAAIYVRISSDPTGRALGVARQEADCRALAGHRGWDVARVYTDNDVSAFDRREIRPAWQQLLDDLRAGRLDALIVYDMDRIARRTRDLDDLLEVYERRPSVGFGAVTGELDLASSGGRMVARMLVSVATKASEDTGRRVARKHLELAQKGLPAGGRRAFGYAGDFTTVVEPEAEAIREAARRVLAGEPLTSIIDNFHARWVAAATPTQARTIGHSGRPRPSGLARCPRP